MSWKVAQQGKPRQANVQLSLRSDLMDRTFASGMGEGDERFSSVNYLNPTEVSAVLEVLSLMPPTLRHKNWSLSSAEAQNSRRWAPC